MLFELSSQSMSDQAEAETKAKRVPVLDFWKDGQTWFQRWIPRELPWGSDAVLSEVPKSMQGRFGARARRDIVDGGAVIPRGQCLARETLEELEPFFEKSRRVSGLVVPWYDRVIPEELWRPYSSTLSRKRHWKICGWQALRSLLIIAVFVTLAIKFPEWLVLSILIAVFLGLYPLVDAVMYGLKPVYRYSVDQLNQRLVNEEFFRTWILAQPSRGLKVGLGFLVAIYAAQAWFDAKDPIALLRPSIGAAALYKPAVIDGGQWWRLVTTGLMHGSWWHLAFNGMALFSLGRVIQALVSPYLMALVFLVTVVTGSLASLYLGPGNPSVGASGGILGCLGMLLVVTYKFRRALPDFLQANLIQSTIVVTVFGILGHQFIDNAAHAGGLLGGLGLGLILYRSLELVPKQSTLAMRVLGSASLLVICAAAIKVAVELLRLR